MHQWNRSFSVTALPAGCGLLFANTAGDVVAAEPELVSAAMIWDAAPHNAFTDLIRFRDRWVCTFRESEAHVGGEGKIRVIESSDGERWQSAALIAEQGIDLRDPKLSITPAGPLMIVAGGSVYEGKKLVGRQPRVMFSPDAHEWSSPERVLEEGDWLWRVTWHEGKAYGVSYGEAELTTPAAKEAAKTAKGDARATEWKLKLVASDDGKKYELVTLLDVTGHPNETTLRFLPQGEMLALTRREAGDKVAWLGRSSAPYKNWVWQETKHQVGGPNFLRLPNGQLWAVGRSYPGGAKTVVAKMSLEGEYTPLLTLPSGDDTSYAGLVWHVDQLWISYYSSHEGKSKIYLAKVRLPRNE